MREGRIGFFVLWIGAMGCHGGSASKIEAPPGTPVVLISIDTLRSDRLPAYGYGGVATPAIDALCQDGILYEQAYSHSPLTLPSHLSILTGLLPSEHRVRDNMGYRLDVERSPALQKSLKERGYATGAAVSSFVLRRGTGIESGFDFYDDAIPYSPGVALSGLQRPGSETLKRAVEWMEPLRSKPFFLFFHIYEPHSPHEPPEPFASRYMSPYDGEIAAADQIVGDLLQQLRRLGLYDKSLVLLVSDHGEGLGEHGEEEHGIFLYRSTLQVPLILKLPNSELAGSREPEPVQLVDIYPTVMSVLGFKLSQATRGDPLLEMGRSGSKGRTLYAETLYPRLHFGWSDLASVIKGRFHYIESPDPELFDIIADPGELRNLVPSMPDAHHELEQELAVFDRSIDSPESVDSETRRRLASLGYVGSTSRLEEGKLPDPKTRLGILEDLKKASALFAESKFEMAIPLFRQFLERQPTTLDAWEQLGRSLEALGRDREALEAYKAALKRFPETHALSPYLARLYLETGVLDLAQAHAEIATEVDPPSGHALLSQVALKKGDLVRAEQSALEAMSWKDRRSAPELAYADVLIAKGQYERALQVLDAKGEEFTRAKAEKDLTKGLFFLRGKALANLGDVRGAERSFFREIELFPSEVQAYAHLAVLYGVAGEPKAAVKLLDRLLQANPSAQAYSEAVKALRIARQGSRASRLLREALQRYPDDPALEMLRSPRTAP